MQIANATANVQQTARRPDGRTREDRTWAGHPGRPTTRASQSGRQAGWQEAVLVAVRAKLVNCQSELLSWFAYYAKVFVVPETFTFARPPVHPSARSWVIKTLKDASGRDKSCFSLFTWSALRCSGAAELGQLPAAPAPAQAPAQHQHSWPSIVCLVTQMLSQSFYPSSYTFH